MRVVRVVYYLLHVLWHSVCSWKYVVWPLTELTLVTRHARLSTWPSACLYHGNKGQDTLGVWESRDGSETGLGMNG